MRPRELVVWAAALVPAVAHAAEGWPDESPAGWGRRGPGGGLAVLPLVAVCLCLWAWLATVDWVARDSRTHKFRPALWSTIVTLPFVAAAVGAWWIPSTIGAILLMIAAWLGPVAAYATARNRQVPEGERIFTTGHAWRVLAHLLAPLGIEITPPGGGAEVLPTVRIQASGGRDAAENTAREERAAATPGLEEAHALLQAAVVGRATTVLIEPDPEGIAVQFEVDGVWEKPRVRKPPRNRKEKETFPEAPRPSRDTARAVIETLATFSGLSHSRSGQSGPFVMQVDGKPRNCRLAVRGADQVVVQIEPPAVVFRKPADIAMPDVLAERLVGLLALEKGLVVISSPPASGLTTTFDVVVQMADRLLRDFISIEDAAAPPREIQNVKPVRFDARTGVTPVEALQNALREYPRAIVTRDLKDQALACELARLAAEDQLVIVSMKASDAVDAVSRLLASGIPADVLARTLVGSLAQRLVRKLCPKCREEYPTPPDLLARLKLTPEQLPHLRKASEHGCRLCGGTGYLGRTAIFELASGSNVRKAVAAAVDPVTLRKAAAQDGMKPMRDSGMALVIAGATSIEEVQRVLSAKPQPAAPPAAGAKKS